MKRKFFGMLLMGAMTIASVSMFTSCKDYDDDINNLQTQIDAITKQDLQNQLNTLKSALESAKSELAAADAKALQAAADAKKAGDDAATAAETAQKRADAAYALADAAATKEKVAQLEKAIEDLTPLINGKVDKSEYEAKIQKIEADIVAIDDKLLTLDDVQGLLDKADFAKNAVIQDLISQINALNTFKANIEGIAPIGDAEWKAAVDAAIASLEGIKSDIANKADKTALDAKADKTDLDAKAEKAEVEDLKTRMQTAEGDLQKLNDLKIGDKLVALGDRIDALNVLLDRVLKSIVLRPDTYYGGIEGISVLTLEFPKEKNNPERPADMYRYFDRVGKIYVSDYGFADYHVNPSNADLSTFSIDFYNHLADIKEPAAWERETPTRAGDATGIFPVYNTIDTLLKADKNYLKGGILTVPFKAYDASKIEDNLKIGKGTIASLMLYRKGDVEKQIPDTTINSDYALVVPRYGYGLLIGDKEFESLNDKEYEDVIGYDGGDVNSANLHRCFSFLALAATSPTHEIKYDGTFDITAVLKSRVVMDKAVWEAIKDTAVYVSHDNHQATAEWKGEITSNKEKDGDCTIAREDVWDLSDKDMERLGLTYDIQLVNYVLGSTQTGESVHLQLEKDEATGHILARPCNVTDKGVTIPSSAENPANQACVGRQPIVCIMVKKGEEIVSFAYMKFLIVDHDPIIPTEKEKEFEIPTIFVNCEGAKGEITWSQFEKWILDDMLKMSKKTFDLNYVFDYYAEKEEEVDTEGATYTRVIRYGRQYADNNGILVKASADDAAFGTVSEEWNKSAQDVEDATTHIIKWEFTADELTAQAEALKAAKKLEDKGDYYANTEDIVTWVRYAHLNYDPAVDAPAKGAKPTKGKPAIWIKLVLKAGDLRVAKGDMSGSKILTFWYDLNSENNAKTAADAHEVRVNVPVPVSSKPKEDPIGYSIKDKTSILSIQYDNLLEKANDPIGTRANLGFTEFTKDLKDFFVDGKLIANVNNASFTNINKNGVKLGCEFITPSQAIGNAQYFSAAADGTWTVKGYSGTTYTLKINEFHNVIFIVKDGNTVVNDTLVSLNYDINEDVDKRQITVLNYQNGVRQDDILNYMTHEKLGERETFTAYINIIAVESCAPVYWENMWFNVRLLRPLDLENPKQGVVPDAPNDWHTVDLTDALIVKDWRDYYGDRQNRTGGKDVSLVLPSVGNQKAFDYAYYQVKVEIQEDNYYTDAAQGTSERNDNFTPGHMPVVENEADAKAKYIKTSSVPRLLLEKVGDTKLKYLNNSGVNGGFHVFVPITMTYVYGSQTVRQTKWVTVGVTATVSQPQFEQ